MANSCKKQLEAKVLELEALTAIYTRKRAHAFVFISMVVKEGQYTHELVKLAEPPRGSDISDSNLCPNFV